MRHLRLFMLLLIVLFAADVVQAAPAALVMQLDSIAHPADMPCHETGLDATQPDGHHDAGAHDPHCHSCFACVTLLTPPSFALSMPALRHVLAPHPDAFYQPCGSAPALRPPILA